MNTYVTSEEMALDVLDEYFSLKPKIIAVDTETKGLNWEMDDMFLVQIGWGWNSNYAFPIEYLRYVAQILEDPYSAKALANIKFDAHFLERAGIKLGGTWHDIQVMARLLFPKAVKGKRVSLKLKDLAVQLIDQNANDAEIAVKKWMATENRRRSKVLTKELRELGYTRKQYDAWKKADDPFPEDVNQLLEHLPLSCNYADVPKELMEPYSTNDTRYTLALFNRFLPVLKQNQLMGAYKRDMKTIRHVYGWENTGWCMNGEGLSKGLEHGKIRLKTLSQELDELAEGLNPNSDVQIKEHFHAKGKPIPNAQADTLKKLDDPVASKILEFKGYDKIVGTYLKPMHFKTQATGGRLHGGFNVAGPVTGRFSSSNPNLQNIPKEFKDDLVNPRNYFVPSKDFILVFMDYS